MQAPLVGAAGFALALGVFVALAFVLVLRRSGAPGALPCALASALSALWAAVWFWTSLQSLGPGWPAFAADGLRGLAWLAAMLALLKGLGEIPLAAVLGSRIFLLAAALAVVPVVPWAFNPELPRDSVGWVAGGYAVSLFGVLGAEQAFRNVSGRDRAFVTYVSLAVGGLFLFDLVMFVFGLAGAPLDAAFLAARGWIAFLVSAPLLFVAWRRPEPVTGSRQPRRIALHAFGAVSLSLYVVLVTVGYQYVHRYGGSWAAVAGVVLVTGAIAAAVFVLASASLRSRIRVGVSKTFFQYKYDYREEWLRFIATLSDSGFEDVPATAVRAIAPIVNSPGGVLFVEEPDSGEYVPAGSWRAAEAGLAPVPGNAGLVAFLRDRQWVIDLEEFRRHPARYEGLEPDSWLVEGERWWLVVPLFLGRRLLGFVVLARPRAAPSLNFEDHDLLKTVGRHVGMHINQAEADRRLAESRQFGTYNRLTAFLMHDLNNLIAQQSLVVTNAERFRDNPQFVDDAIATIANSVARMRRLMEQLNRGSKAPKHERVELGPLLERVVETCSNREPRPTLDGARDAGIVSGDAERLANGFEHLVRNAQDATRPDGEIRIEVRLDRAFVRVTIADTGSGMSPEFVRERLFRPFESTKGSGSMGIGAYQAREYVKSIGGQLEVSSKPGAGTTFTVRLPRGI